MDNAVSKKTFQLRRHLAKQGLSTLSNNHSRFEKSITGPTMMKKNNDIVTRCQTAKTAQQA